MVHDTVHVVNTWDTVLYKELATSEYTCKHRSDLQDQLKEVLKELNSARIIIKLLQQEATGKITSNHDNTNQNNNNNAQRTTI